MCTPRSGLVPVSPATFANLAHAATYSATDSRQDIEIYILVHLTELAAQVPSVQASTVREYPNFCGSPFNSKAVQPLAATVRVRSLSTELPETSVQQLRTPHPAKTPQRLKRCM